MEDNSIREQREWKQVESEHRTCLFRKKWATKTALGKETGRNERNKILPVNLDGSFVYACSGIRVRGVIGSSV